MKDKANSTYLCLTDINVDPACQARAEMNTDTIDDYAATMRVDDEVFPAVTVYHDGSEYWLADGFHRYRAAQKAGLRSLGVDIHKGSRRDAILHSVGANATHGLRRTREDKRHAVSILLGDSEWSAWSNRKIADCCGVDEKMVRTLRSASAAKPQIARKVERNGIPFEMKTGNIGKKDGRAEPSPIQSGRKDEPEQVWDHAREPAGAHKGAPRRRDDEQASCAQASSSGEVQLDDLMYAWDRASGGIREQFLVKIGVSLNLNVKPNHLAVADAASSMAQEPSPVQDDPCATELQQGDRLFEMWKGYKSNTRADGFKWVADDCPSVYQDSHFMITETLVPFRQAAREAVPQERAAFLALARVYQTENQYS